MQTQLFEISSDNIWCLSFHPNLGLLHNVAYPCNKLKVANSLITLYNVCKRAKSLAGQKAEIEPKPVLKAYR